MLSCIVAFKLVPITYDWSVFGPWLFGQELFETGLGRNNSYQEKSVSIMDRAITDRSEPQNLGICIKVRTRTDSGRGYSDIGDSKLVTRLERWWQNNILSPRTFTNDVVNPGNFEYACLVNGDVSDLKLVTACRCWRHLLNDDAANVKRKWMLVTEMVKTVTNI